MENKTVLEMRNIHKSFPGVRALQAVDFTLEEGEIHGPIRFHFVKSAKTFVAFYGHWCYNDDVLLYDAITIRI